MRVTGREREREHAHSYTLASTSHTSHNTHIATGGRRREGRVRESERVREGRKCAWSGRKRWREEGLVVGRVRLVRSSIFPITSWGKR